MMMIRRSVLSLKFANVAKRAQLVRFTHEARRVLRLLVNDLWLRQEFNNKFYDTKTFRHTTWLSARALQALGKQALQVVKSQRKKKRKTKPSVNRFSVELDERFVRLSLDETNSFDCWVTLGSLGDGLKLVLPCRRHEHLNRLLNDGWRLKKSTRLRQVNDDLFLDVFFEKERPTAHATGATLSLDQGYRKLAVTSDGQVVGGELPTLIAKVVRKKRGSRSCRRALVERDQYVNRSVKELSLKNVKMLVIEDLKNVKHKSRLSRLVNDRLSHWTYSQFVSRLEHRCAEEGVLLQRVNPAYTSQRCSACGCVNKLSRRGEAFQCVSCGHHADADLNAARNILFLGVSQELIGPGRTKLLRDKMLS